MARLFQALVVLGGSLAGCGGRAGSDVGRTNNEGADSQEETDVASTRTSVESTSTASEDDSDSPIITIPTDVPTDAQPETTDAPSDSTIVLDNTTAAPNLPDECAPETWSCDGLQHCRSDRTPSCGEAWNGEIESCPFALDFADCSCAEAGAPQACEEGEIRTCLHSERVTAEGRTEMLHFACECLPVQDTCELVCSQHSNGAGGRACVEAPGLVLCGGCIWAGILR